MSLVLLENYEVLKSIIDLLNKPMLEGYRLDLKRPPLEQEH